MKFVLSFLFFGLVSTIHAENSSLPQSCNPLLMEGITVTLSAKKILLVMIHNLSKTDLWITHPVSEPGASAGWSSRLQTGNWSALALDQDSFELSCIESKPGHEQQVPCSEVISVCEWPTVILPDKEKGTFWAGENMALPELTGHLRGRGFKLPALT